MLPPNFIPKFIIFFYSITKQKDHQNAKNVPKYLKAHQGCSDLSRYLTNFVMVSLCISLKNWIIR